MTSTTTPLWQPTAQRIASARLTDYRAWLARSARTRLPRLRSPLGAGRRAELGAFWGSLWEYFDVIGTGNPQPALLRSTMPRAPWFPQVELNYVEQVFRHATAARPAIVAGDETGRVVEIGWPELQQKVAALAATLRTRGVQRGDRVAAFMPNTSETVVAFLASASLGAIWSVCSPDMGAAACSTASARSSRRC